MWCFNTVYLYQNQIMKHAMLIIAILLQTGFSTCSQSSQNSNLVARPGAKVGGGCEGCEAIYECPVAFDQLKNSTELADWQKSGTKLVVSGIVFKADGRTPAPGVVLYVYHTDQTGIYPKRGDEKGWARRHGYLRGWMKTDEKGQYQFYTLRPAPYPGRKDPSHIHITVKEPDKNEYWIDEYLFDDDPLLTVSQRKMCEDRGGSGILTIHKDGANKNLVKVERNIYLGKNIPNYPK